jgi:hypothetical protein
LSISIAHHAIHLRVAAVFCALSRSSVTPCKPRKCLPSVGKRRNCARVKLATTKDCRFPHLWKGRTTPWCSSITLNAEGWSRTRRRSDHNDGDEQHAPARRSCAARPLAEAGCTKFSQPDNGQVFCSRSLRCRCELSCIADGQRRRIAGQFAIYAR